LPCEVVAPPQRKLKGEGFYEDHERPYSHQAEEFPGVSLRRKPGARQASALGILPRETLCRILCHDLSRAHSRNVRTRH
jgi:hypothetical protein